MVIYFHHLNYISLAYYFFYLYNNGDDFIFLKVKTEREMPS